MSILCVEDEPITRTFLSQIIALKYPTRKIHTAADGKTGLEMFRKIEVAVVLTDISMPEMDGIRMAREIQSLKPGTPIIALSAHSSLKGDAKDLNRLFWAYIPKPIMRNKLFDAIDKCLLRTG